MKNQIPFLIAFFALAVSCASDGIRNYFAPPADAVKDIPARKLVYERYLPPKNTNLRDPVYFKAFLEGVRVLRDGDARSAFEKFTFCISRFHDEGNALFLRASCQSQLGNHEDALKDYIHANQAGYESDKTHPRIADILWRMSEARVKEKEWGPALGLIKAAQEYDGNPAIREQAFYCYLQLADARTGFEKIMTLFHAFNHAKKVSAGKSNNVLALSLSLGSALLESGDPALARKGIPLVGYSLDPRKRDESQAALHQTLGYLYAYIDETLLAKRHFGEVVRRYPRSKFHDGCLKQFHAMERQVYDYTDLHPFVVSSDESDVSGLSFSITACIPQTIGMQRAWLPELYVNSNKLAYTIKKDKYGTAFLQADARGLLRKGTNSMAIRTSVEKAGYRIPVQRVSAFFIDSYDKNAPWYPLFTESGGIVQLQSPVVRGMVAELRGRIKGNNLHEVVSAIYLHVMDKLTYKLYDNDIRPKSSILDRLQRENFYGLCEDYAVLTVALLRSFGIPACCHTGPVLNEKVGHAWAVFMLPDGTPVTLDTTWGDNPSARNHYLYYASNLLVTVQKGYASDLVSPGSSLHIRGDGRLKVSFMKGETRITRGGKPRGQQMAF